MANRTLVYYHDLANLINSAKDFARRGCRHPVENPATDIRTPAILLAIAGVISPQQRLRTTQLKLAGGRASLAAEAQAV